MQIFRRKAVVYRRKDPQAALCLRIIILVARTGLEPVQLAPRDFKSLVSTNFTIGPMEEEILI